MRFQAVTIAAAQGQAAAILRKRRGPLRTRRSAACGMRSAASSARPGPGSVQGEQAEPGQQGRGGQRGGLPGPVHRQRSGTCRSPCRGGWRPRRGHGPGGRRRCRRSGPASPSCQTAGSLPTGSTASVPGLEQGKLGAGGRPLPTKTRIASGQPSSWSPPGPSRSSEVSSATCAASIQHRRCPQPGSPQASSARRSRTCPRASTAICQAPAGTAQIAARSRPPSSQPTE